MVEQADARLTRCTLEQCAGQHLTGGAAAGVQNAAASVTCFKTEIVLERHTVVPELANRAAAFAGQDIDCAGVVEAGANRQCVSGVQRGGIVGADGRGDTTLSAWARAG